MKAAGKEAPIVRNRAIVAIGESFVTERNIVEARKNFEKVIEDPKADALTLAAAYSGLGDCIFQVASKKLESGQDAKAELTEASLAFLRVVVLYPDQIQYRPRAMFYAGRSLQLMGDEENVTRAKTLYARLIRTFPDSKAAKEARGVR
ncbi:MAG: tetratricopeptide repeat protein [Planctomycetota bacterium]